MAGSKKGSQAKGKPPPAKGRQQSVRRPPVQAPRPQKRGVMAPVATNVSNGRNGSKTVRLVERERVATLSGSAAFKVQHTMQINPALPAFLPWLSTMAQLYEKYRVKSIRVMYHNLCGTNTAGNVLMAFDPDVLDSAPVDAVSFSQSTRYIDGAPWRMLTLNIPGSNQSFFTRAATAPSGSDLKTYDYGQIHVATEAMGDESTVGYLEIAYDIEFLERQPAPAAGGSYSFRPQVYAGVPDPTVPVVFETLGGLGIGPAGPGRIDRADVAVLFDGIIPLQALVDDIGVSGFDGSLVLPPGAYALTSSLPRGGYANDATCATPTTGQPLAPPLAERLLAALGIVPAPKPSGSELLHPPYLGWWEETSGGVDDQFHPGEPTFKWVDSAGQTIDAVGVADLTGVSLRAKFSVSLFYYKNNQNQTDSAYQVNGVIITNNYGVPGRKAYYTTNMQPSTPGEGVWPTAVITQLAA